MKHGMNKWFSSVLSLIKKFEGIRIEHVAQEQNSHADALLGLALACYAFEPRSILFRTIDKQSFELEILSRERMNINLEPSWMDEITTYLRDDTLPTNKKEALQLRNKAALYWLNPDVKLYPRSFTGSYLLIAHPSQGPNILQELHAGESGCHSEGQSLAGWATQGY